MQKKTTTTKNVPQKSIFSCNTNNKTSQIHNQIKPKLQNSRCDLNNKLVQNATQTSRKGSYMSFSSVIVENGSKTSHQVVTHEKLMDKLKSMENQEFGTQTSKTILQLAKMESGTISPDSLSQSPKDGRYYSELTPCHSCEIRPSKISQNCLLVSDENTSQEHILDAQFGGNALTKRFLEKTQQKQSDRPKSYLRSKSYVDPAHMACDPEMLTSINYQIIQNQVTRCTQTADLSVYSKNTVPLTPKQSSYMLPTNASRIKNKLNEIKKIKQLIPPTRRGRSSSPKRMDEGMIGFEGDGVVNRKVPYIDQSCSNFGSDTTVVRRTAYDNASDSDGAVTVNLESCCETALSKGDNQPSIDNVISASIAKLRDEDWNLALVGLSELVEICRMTDTNIILPFMPQINQRLIQLLKSPRSYVTRTACQASGHLFEYVKDTRRPEFDDIVDILLFKTADANRFIREDANMALDCMVTHIPTFHAVRTLCAKGPNHKNPLVRTATVRLLICVVVIVGPDFILSPSNNEFTRKRIFLNMARFLEDRNMDTRKYAERLYKVLSKEPLFDSSLRKYFEKDFIGKIKRTLKIVHKK